jgi:hypothetical protein
MVGSIEVVPLRRVSRHGGMDITSPFTVEAYAALSDLVDCRPLVALTWRGRSEVSRSAELERCLHKRHCYQCFEGGYWIHRVSVFFPDF